MLTFNLRYFLIFHQKNFDFIIFLKQAQAILLLFHHLMSSLLLFGQIFSQFYSSWNFIFIFMGYYINYLILLSFLNFEY